MVDSVREFSRGRITTTSETLTRTQAIQYLKSALNDEELGSDQQLPQLKLGSWILSTSGAYLDELVAQECEQRLKEAMARRIQRAFRTVVADPQYSMCRRRLLREFVELHGECVS